MCAAIGGRSYIDAVAGQKAASPAAAVVTDEYRQKVLPVHRLEEVGEAPDRAGLLGQVGLAIGRDEDDGHAASLQDAAGSLQPVQPRQADVHEDQVWRQGGRHRHRLLAVPGQTHHLMA